jgi:hypothetical protein
MGEWKRRGGLRIFVFLAALLAAGLGVVGAHSRPNAEPFPLISSSACSHLSESTTTEKKTVVGKRTVVNKKTVTKDATVTEILDVHSRAQPVTYFVTEIVTVPADNHYARALIREPGSAAARQADACLFSYSVSRLPQFTSAADGMVTFSDSGQWAVPVNEWQSAVHPGGTQISFDPQLMCGSYPLDKWAGTTLTLTVRSDEALGPVTPVPGSLDGTTYSWRSPAGSCGKLPRISVRVPTSLAGALSSATFGPGLLGNSILPEILGWADPILTGLIALWLALRIPRTVRKSSAALALVIVALLGIALAVIDLSRSQEALRGPAEVAAVCGVSLGLLLILRTSQEQERETGAAEEADHRPGLSVSRRAGLALTAAGCAGTAALLACAYRYPVWFPGASYLLTAAAAVLLVAAGAVVCGIARAVPVTDEPRLPTPAWAAIGKVRDSLVFWAGAALLVALAYSMGHVVDFSLGESVALSEYSILRYPLATFSQVLIPVALVLPLAYQGSPARKVVAAAAFGFSMVTSQPDVQVGGWAIPLGTVLLGVLVYAIVRKDDQPAEQANGTVADTVLAVKIAAPLALIPVGYFIYTTAARLPAAVQDPGPDTVFVVVSFLSQLTGWLVIGVFYGLLSSRLPGRIGPARALVLAGAWFAVAIAVNIVNNVLHYPANKGWIFAGLQFTLFLIAFSVVWDACALKQDTVSKTVDKLRAAYHLKETQAIALYAIPVVLALVALVQQLASGSGADFVTGILNGAAAAFGGKG